MSRTRTQPAAFAATLFCLAALFSAGCSMGFTNLHPDENSGLYANLFEDVINNFDEPYWLWVRGTIAGDMNGNGIIEEEVVIATIQKGSKLKPGPIEMAFLVVCETAPDGQRKAVARVRLFDGSPIAGAPRPTNDLGRVAAVPLTRTRAQIVQDKATLREQVVVYFWSDVEPGTVWYAGYRLEAGGLVKNLEVAMNQANPGFLTANLDPSVEATPFGYQLVFQVAALPDALLKKLGAPQDEPFWGHAYARNAEGHYEQADWRYGQDYKRVEAGWNRAYLKALMLEFPPEDLAWFEYHMGLLNLYTGDHELGNRYLEKAEKHARDGILAVAVEKALEYARTLEKPWPPKKAESPAPDDDAGTPEADATP